MLYRSFKRISCFSITEFNDSIHSLVSIGSISSLEAGSAKTFLTSLKGCKSPFVLGFSFISSISSFFGYFTRGGALAVGKSSTKSVVYSCIVILIMNFILTQLMLA